MTSSVPSVATSAANSGRRASHFGSSTWSQIFFWRMLPMTLLLLATVNPWGFSYYHWAKYWAAFVWAGMPMISDDDKFQLLALVSIGAAAGTFYGYTLFFPHCKWRGIGIGGVLLRRVIPLAAIAAGAYFWYWDQIGRWFVRLAPRADLHMSFMGHVAFALFLLVGTGLLIWWVYATRKAWQGLGSSRLMTAIALAALAVVVYFFYEIRLFPKSVSGIIGFVEIIAGLGLGFCFWYTSCVFTMKRMASWVLGV